MNYVTPPSRVILQTKQELTYGSAFKKQGKIYLVIELKVVDPKKSETADDVIVVEHSYWVVENFQFKKLPFEDRGDGSIPGVAKLTKDEVNQLGAWVLATFPSVGSLPEYDREIAMLQKGSYAMVGQMAAKGKMGYDLTPADLEDYTPIEIPENEPKTT
jgi:hypothetical protein